ncbi:MAG: hypothetical protein EB059_00970 [Alphaproteobacteria bacterium]|nr:hypothetical protein [Alphaproteobacteria bacterium]
MKLKFIGALLLALCACPVFAQTDVTVPLAPAPLASGVSVPDTSNILFLQNMRKIGATIYYLGESLGLHGWFLVKDGQVQILYTTPDQKAIMIGALLSAEGANVSQQQVMVLANNNPEIANILKNSAAVTGQPPVKVPEAKAPEIKAPVAQAAPQPSPQASQQIPPSEKFFDALLKSASVTFGKDSAPQLLMIMDVNCSHCHKAWKEMQPLVDAGKLRVTMIPIGAIGPQSETEGASWLLHKDPYDAWKKHVAGDASIFKTGATSEKEAAVRANTDLIRKWGVDQTPYILYHGKNGKVRLIVGEPKSVDDIIKDIM